LKSHSQVQLPEQPPEDVALGEGDGVGVIVLVGVGVGVAPDGVGVGLLVGLGVGDAVAEPPPTCVIDPVTSFTVQ
jgi:hypothetical protein